MSRGRLEWLITVPQDGRLFLHGIAPVLIQWPGDVHPTHTLEPRNCRLRQLRGVNPEAGSINAFLAAIGFQGPVAIVPPSPGQPAPCLEAQIETPTGVRTLGSG